MSDDLERGMSHMEDRTRRIRPLVPEGSVLVKAGSHRARWRLVDLAGHKLRSVFEIRPLTKSWPQYVVLPVELLPQALEIPMVTRGKPKGELFRCW
jgi:hypothetical protein